MSEHRCTCGTLMFYDQEKDMHVCFPCAHKEAVRRLETESARDAIVEAADAHEKIARYDEHDNAHTHWTYRQLLYTVDAWRKLREE